MSTLGWQHTKVKSTKSNPPQNLPSLNSCQGHTLRRNQRNSFSQWKDNYVHSGPKLQGFKGIAAKLSIQAWQVPSLNSHHRFCAQGSDKTREHLQLCGGTRFEQRGLDLSDKRGLLDFWRRMKMKLAAVARPMLHYEAKYKMSFMFKMFFFI